MSNEIIVHFFNQDVQITRVRTADYVTPDMVSPNVYVPMDSPDGLFRIIFCLAEIVLNYIIFESTC